MPDALIVDTKTGKVEGILEVKCPFTKDMNTYASHALQRLRLSARPTCMMTFQSLLSTRVVPHQTMSAIYYHMPQVQGYMEILDVEYCDLMSYTAKVHILLVPSLSINHCWLTYVMVRRVVLDVQGSVIFRIMRDRTYWVEMLPALVEFWTHLRRDTPPPEKHANSKTIEKCVISCPLICSVCSCASNSSPTQTKPGSLWRWTSPTWRTTGRSDYALVSSTDDDFACAGGQLDVAPATHSLTPHI
jgi:hypothetical protein